MINANQFVDWLRGFLDRKPGLSDEELLLIRDKLKDVYRVTEPAPSFPFAFIPVPPMPPSPVPPLPPPLNPFPGIVVTG